MLSVWETTEKRHNLRAGKRQYKDGITEGTFCALHGFFGDKPVYLKIIMRRFPDMDKSDKKQTEAAAVPKESVLNFSDEDVEVQCSMKVTAPMRIWRMP